jgi:Co/Zn/Cd efflux system component
MMKITTINVSKMDCPSEEQLIRMKLQNFNAVKSLEFDIPDRRVTIYHDGEAESILLALETLNLNTTLISTVEADTMVKREGNSNQRRLLWAVLTINLVFFGVEILSGILSNSMGLVADSLDMLADSIVYALALFAVGGTVARKNEIARFAGYFQIILAVIGFIEVIRRFLGFERMPDFKTMIIVSTLALMANILCLYLLQRERSKESHMQASMIFTSNDVVVNSGVIVAGLLVNWLNSSLPDLIVGATVFVVVTRGAYTILRLAK